MKRILPRLLASVFVVATSGLLSANTVLFSDAFDARTTGSGDSNGNPAGANNGSSDWGTNDNGAGGTISATYVAGPSRTGGRNQVVGVNAFDAGLGGNGHLFAGGVGANLGTLISQSPDGFTVGFDFDRIADPSISPGGNGYLAFGIGLDVSAGVGDFTAIGSSAFGVLFQQAASGNVGNARSFSNGDSVTHAEFDYGNPDAFHSAFLTFIPTSPGSYGNGSTIDFTIEIDGNVLDAGTFTSNGNDLNQFAFSANDPSFQARYIDNLVISSVTAVPEPGAGAFLVAVGILGAWTVRRRRQRG